MISGQLQGESVTRLSDMQMQKNNADHDLDNHIR